MLYNNVNIITAQDEPVEIARDLGSIISEITKTLLNDYEVQEQKKILDAIKTNLISHYEELRQNHMKGAEEYANKIEFLHS